MFTNYRIIYGFNGNEGLSQGGREGWWWNSDVCCYDNEGIGYPSSPEGPFVSKAAATFHMRYLLKHEGREPVLFKGWAKHGGNVSKPTMRLVPIRLRMLTHYGNRREESLRRRNM